ncbi:DNA polymerase III subunit delta' [Corynebacterium terpenotabidum]|uniref:DNA polymerase III subunit delta n=1 Tax=Corynebacterium terpenotabidum Y-11 TaxID=1200352 RepID=S4XIW7_9CORY|nr:DNA polymerase III subunit delta' [Corynebacterium terpenotabidum]AGP31700.1 DNA polymerase III subunit delta [Corynebacterium terpenotabidum Y-11]
MSDVFSRAALSPHVTGPLRDAVASARHRVADRDRFGVSDAAVNDAAMTHSWLFTGPPGSGRSVAAGAFATALVCSDPEVAGCGACDGCRSAAAGTHPDISWIRTDGVTIPVDEVRGIIRTSAVLPSVARWRVVIVEDADRLGDSGANALLKSVEEPPAHTVFLLCAPSTDPEDISITLRSRCRHVYVPTPSEEEVEAVLVADARLGLTAEQAHWAASVSGGHIGRARHLALDEAARTKRAAALRLPGLIYRSGEGYRFTAELVKTATAEAAASVASLEEHELAELESSLGMGAKGRGVAKAQVGAAGQIKELEKMQKNRRTRMLRDALDLALIDIAGLYRDAMMVAVGAVENAGEDAGVDAGADASAEAAGNPVGGFLHPDQQKVSRELARRNSPEALVRCIDAVSDCRETLGRNVKPEVALTGMVGRLRECCGQV